MTDPTDPVVAGMEPANGLLPVTMAIGEYDRTRALLDGRVKPDGIDLRATSASIPEFCLTPVYEEYDFAEMSLFMSKRLWEKEPWSAQEVNLRGPT